MNTAGCTCRVRWPRLYVAIDGVRWEVEPTQTDTPTSAMFRAWCAGCGAEYTYPFRTIAAQSRAA